jgi:mannitol/fructose-specific phosphotransferase system IIA component (Ntr-type)
MEFDDVFGSKDFVPDMKATDRWEAIDELITHLVATGRINPEIRDAVAAAVKKREASMSTGIGLGIGIPHAATDLVTKAVGAVGRSKQGIDFDALDGQPVKTVALFLVPKNFQSHLLTLANIAKALGKADFR